MKYIILSYLILNTSLSVFSCSCAPITNLQERQEQAYRDSNLIFVGMVVTENSEKNTYTMKIIELLKGDYPDSLIIGKSYPNGCSLWPEKGIPWLIYTNIGNDKIINIEECSLSRSFDFPYIIHESATVPPPTSDIEYDEQPVAWMLDLAIRGTAYRRKALIVLQKEIREIRNRHK